MVVSLLQSGFRPEKMIYLRSCLTMHFHTEQLKLRSKYSIETSTINKQIVRSSRFCIPAHEAMIALT